MSPHQEPGSEHGERIDGVNGEGKLAEGNVLANHTNRGGTTSSTQLPSIYAEIIGNSAAESRNVKQHRASAGKKVTARSMPYGSTTSLNSLSSQVSNLKPDSVFQGTDETDQETRNAEESRYAQQHPLLSQVSNWLRNEKSKLAAKKRAVGENFHIPGSGKQDSDSTEFETALEQLERILVQYSRSGRDTTGIGRRGSWLGSRRSAVKGLRRGSASESDQADPDYRVPNADVVLDNSKTLTFSGGEADSDIDPLALNKISTKDRESWLHFKSEVVRLTHTLSIKGWRRVPLEAGGEIEVVRLSGALTNAVYVISPPKNLPQPPSADPSIPSIPRKPPPKLLLRVYGPQVEHLIDREHELQILRRLGKKNIGPRVLGTFKNGRFEQYFHATTLTPRDLRIPETSKQIAKRMRELHDGIELLPEEREKGPTIFNNWDKWVGRCEKVISWLDREILSEQNEAKSVYEPWRKRGFVCGVPWSTFRNMVERYRKFLAEQFGGPAGISKRLVFAHNDTQYGNLLRLQPSGESPLLLPANEHKQLVVIDFEYSSANTRGVEFANHFTEWCYNYHDEERPWACHAKWYPTVEEQERFIRAYLTHKPHLVRTPANPQTQRAIDTPMSPPSTTSSYTSSPRLRPFVLDSSDPILNAPITELEPRDPAVEADIQKLLQESRLWRIANSAQWVAWGIVQAKVAGMEEALRAEDAAAISRANSVATESSPENPADTELESAQPTSQAGANNSNHNEQVRQEVEADEAAEEFDYLGYAQDRALFFWADILTMGFVKEEELPVDMVPHIKSRVIQY